MGGFRPPGWRPVAKSGKHGGEGRREERRMITVTRLAIVFSLAASTALAQTTTTTVAPVCSGPTYVSVVCQKNNLLLAVQNSSDFKRPEFQQLLERQLGLLQNRIDRAQSKKGKAAKNWLKGAIRVTIDFVHRVNSHTGKHSLVDPSRTTFITMADALRNDLTTLRGATQ